MADTLTWSDRCEALEIEIDRLRAALEQIAAIENEEWGGDWDEIERAREMARAALGR